MQPKNLVRLKEVRNTVILLFIGLVSFVSPSCGQKVKEQEKSDASKNISNQQAKTFIIPVEGMSCGACASNVKKTVKSLDGVTDVEVSLENREAKVTYNNKKISPEDVQKAINGLGYKAGKPVEAKE
jgi:Cu+-exporting ATPase